MNKDKTRNSYLGFWMALIAMMLNGCIAEDIDNNDLPASGSALLRLELGIPATRHAGVKSMSNAQEEFIDYSTAQVLVFEKSGANETFSYKANIVSTSDGLLTLRVPVSEAGEEYRFVVIANSDSPTDIAPGMSKNDALNLFEFGSVGQWNASGSAPRPIPMWGELAQPMVIKKDRTVSILLHRAVARIDVGNRFLFNASGATDDTDTELVLGLNNFKIKEIHLYRTRNKGYMASLAEKIVDNVVVAPHIPSDALTDPIVYTLPAASDRFIREIYVPESFVTSGQADRDNVPCIVVGGYYGENNTSSVTYYRADFANYVNGAPSVYKPVLRNHRYVFDIQSVASSGFPEPEQALNAVNASMSFEVKEWNEVPLNYYVQGNYYFKMASRDVWLEARAEGNETTISYTVPYQTNLLMDAGSKPFAWTWQNSGTDIGEHFDVAFDYDNGQLIFTAKQENVSLTSVILHDRLTLRVENFELTIDVNQKAYNASYWIDCSSVKVHGKYREGVALNYSNHITLQVVSDNSLAGVYYEVKTLEKNGIRFTAEGQFLTPGTYVAGLGYVHDLELEGTGTLVNESGENVLLPFEVTIVTNSLIDDTCSARIIVGYQTKKILAIGANASYRYGYMLEPNTASRAMVDANMNFGTDPNSTVTMELNPSGNAFTIEYMTAGRGMAGEVIDYNYLLDKLNRFQPDIILTGQAINYLPASESASRRTINLLADFINAGGVMLMFNEYYPNENSNLALVNRIFDTSSLGFSNISLSVSELLFSLPTGNAYEDDMLMNGPFGDVRGKQWGSDGTALYGFNGLPATQTTIYSTKGSSVIAFRHNTKGFVFVGDGGFISNAQRFIGSGYQGSYEYCPFAIDAAYRPIARTNYTGTRNMSVYNSQLFGNMLAWAVEKSELEGIEYPDSGNKFPSNP